MELFKMFTKTPTETKQLRQSLIKSAVVSALYSLFSSRKKQAAARGGKFLLQDLADAAGVDKSQASRWFSGEFSPNWRIGSLYDVCDALDGELHIEIVDRLTGDVHTPHGIERAPQPTQSGSMAMETVIRVHMSTSWAMSLSQAANSQNSFSITGPDLAAASA